MNFEYVSTFNQNVSVSKVLSAFSFYSSHTSDILTPLRRFNILQNETQSESQCTVKNDRFEIFPRCCIYILHVYISFFGLFRLTLLKLSAGTGTLCRSKIVVSFNIVSVRSKRKL
jgi:hypothetical protein